MGIGLRIFFVHDDDSIQRLPLARYERLVGRDPEERFPQYAGKRVRYALVVLELANRRPVEITKIQYSILNFDSEGRIDPAEQEREAGLTFEALPPLPKDRQSPHVIDARHKFAQKRYRDVYKWTPSPEIAAAIVEAIFGKPGR